MTLQKFYCPENGISSGEIKEVEIPKYCPECGCHLIVSNDPYYFGNTNLASVFENICEHFDTYSKVWTQQIIFNPVQYGVNCAKCQNFYPYAVKINNFICYGCKVWV